MTFLSRLGAPDATLGSGEDLGIYSYLQFGHVEVAPTPFLEVLLRENMGFRSCFALG